jgi:nuclear pore complex protein Nup205
LKVSGDQYAINEEFQQGTLKLADDLNLDELDAARIFLEAQNSTDSAGRSALTNSIIRFHQRRKYLLDCLCILFRISADVDGPEDLRNYVHGILDQFIRPPQNGPPSYIQRCFSSMNDIKNWLQALAERLNGASVLNQVPEPEVLETIEYQRVSLVKQHESLGIVSFYLVKDNFSSVDDFKGILGTLKKADKYDNLLCEHISNPCSKLFPNAFLNWIRS